MKYTSPQLSQYSRLIRRFAGGILTLLVFVAVASLFSKTVHAGIISFMSSLLGSESASAKIVSPSSNQSSQTLALLQAATNLDPNPEKIGDTLPVHEGETLVADLAASNTQGAGAHANTQISIYVVQPGDTLSGIGEMFHVSVNTILWANDITKATGIQPGQTLVILPVSGITHIVKSGDTITGIVSKYNADLNEVLEYNELTLSSSLSVGQSIILPDVEIATSLPTRIVSGGASSGTKSSSAYYKHPIKSAFTKTQGIHGYNGVDLAGPVGTPIYAAAEGTVIVSLSGGYNGGYGSFIIVSHPNGTQTVYAHLSKNLVKNGDYVGQGDKIGLMGSTGKSTGSHLHFEIRGAKNPF